MVEIGDKRKRVRALITLFLKQMKSLDGDARYYGKNIAASRRLYRSIIEADVNAHYELNSETFFKLDKDQLTTIEKTLTEKLNILKFDISSAFNFVPKEDIVIPGVRDYKQFDGKWARVPLKDENPISETIKKPLREEIYFVNRTIDGKEGKVTEFPGFRENSARRDAVFTDISEETFEKINGEKVKVIKKTYYVEYSREINTIRSWGCLVSSLAIVLSYMKGADITPEDVDSAADKMGAYKNGSNLDYADMIYNNYNLRARNLNVSQYSKDLIINKIDSFLTGDNRKPVILMYGTPGNSHFVVVIGLHHDDYGNTSHYIINDPGNSSGMAKYLDRSTLLCPYNSSRKVTHIISLDGV